ncbi:MAG: hypothetical protein JXA00_02740, partial [Candidatus Thermoplasmatota archaeon]|nr:hypothetical protein [Candidatus Thermoplasmatota archaeon]
MATGHTTYSTVHADSAQSLIHRLEGKPIDIPRVMLQSLDIVTIQVQAELGDQRVRRCKQIVEIIDIDPMTKEILTNEVFRWDPVHDDFMYSGKSYILERIRTQHGMNKEDMMQELRRRVEILEWMKDNNVRAFKDVARMVASYVETPMDLMEKIRNGHGVLPSSTPVPPQEVHLPVAEKMPAEKSSHSSAQKAAHPSGLSSDAKKKFGLFRRDAHNTH